MATLLLTPPVALLILTLVVGFELWSMRALSAKGVASTGKTKPYACGEDITHHRTQPDYSQFFSVAFFFTIMHVVVMIIATIPAGSPEASGMAVLFTLCASLGLFVLFRRDV
ncbi:MAG: NADH-quinone oxidoreductase subunit A [Desulfuromonadales bacterium]|nr:NADH-quinone oxidoreductase subunit A [Desulfuromonadales bacterium]